MSYSPDELHRRVLRTVRRDSCTLDEAFKTVAKELGNSSAQLVGFWGVIGAWWVQQTFADVADTKRVATTPSGGSAPSMTPLRRQGGARVLGTSWREKVDPMEMVYPVGFSGRRKKIGDFTRHDVKTVADTYVQRSVDMLVAARGWQLMHELMHPDETLRSALQRSEVLEAAPDQLRKLLTPATVPEPLAR